LVITAGAPKGVLKKKARTNLRVKLAEKGERGKKGEEPKAEYYLFKTGRSGPKVYSPLGPEGGGGKGTIEKILGFGGKGERQRIWGRCG